MLHDKTIELHGNDYVRFYYSSQAAELFPALLNICVVVFV